MSASGMSLPRTMALLLSVVTGLALSAGATSAVERPPSNPIGEAFSLVFDSESIRLDIVGDSLEVRGTYLLLCRGPVEEWTPLFYPFPHDSLMGGARMVSLGFRDGAGALVSARWEELPLASGVRWWIPPCGGDSIVAEAVYRQRINAGYARYIVTTTRIWGRPLRRASFEIRLPPGAVPIDFSFPFERRKARGETYYAYEAQDFMPDHDIVVHWR